MSKYNEKATSKTVKTVNKAGGEAFKTSARYELVSLLLTSLVNDKFYESAGEQLNRLGRTFDELAKNGDAVFAAKAAIYARNVMGMRSISQALAGNIAAKVSGENWTRRFFANFPHRVDDVTELVAFYQTNFATEKTRKGYKRALPNAMKFGLAKAFDKFDRYQLAKYRGENRDLTLVDVVNLLHPKPTEKNATALHDLVNGTLRSEDTWETKVSAAGQVAENEDEKAELKGAAYADLIRNKKIGYFALLKNLRNILQTAPEMTGEVADMLSDAKLIRKALVFPFRYLDAIDAVNASGADRKYIQKMARALNKAMDIAIENVPDMPGRNLFVLDVSGSMQSGITKSLNSTPAKIGALFTAIMLKKNPNADVVRFASSAAYLKGLNTDDTVLTLAEMVTDEGYKLGGGTNLNAVFNVINKPYDRIVILSDCQSWMSYHAPDREFTAYCKKYDCKPSIFSFDLMGYGTLEFAENKIYKIAGISDKVLSLMSKLEGDKNEMIHAIEAVEL